MSLAMITVDRPELSLPLELNHARGGFAWWYVDWWDEQGNGLVLIWSFGLPFLPGYADSARRGEAPAAGRRPSLNVSVYRDGKPAFYLLQEYPEGEASWNEDGTVLLGDSVLRTWREDGQRRVRIQLDCPVPGTEQRLRGTFVSDGPAIRHGAQRIRRDGEHMWTPLLVGASATAELAVGGETLLSGVGRIYHDRNGSPTPMQELGIERWLWGRAALPDTDLIWYLVWGKQGELVPMCFRVGHDGLLEELPDVTVEEGGSRYAVFGLAYPETLVLRSAGNVVAEVRHVSVVDDGPFYLRMHTEIRDARGVPGMGSGEYLVPDNIDIGWQRPLVRMAVHQVGGANSFWLPLFSGSMRDRVLRLLRVGDVLSDVRGVLVG